MPRCVSGSLHSDFTAVDSVNTRLVEVTLALKSNSLFGIGIFAGRAHRQATTPCSVSEPRQVSPMDNQLHFTFGEESYLFGDSLLHAG